MNPYMNRYLYIYIYIHDQFGSETIDLVPGVGSIISQHGHGTGWELRCGGDDWFQIGQVSNENRAPSSLGDLLGMKSYTII